MCPIRKVVRYEAAVQATNDSIAGIKNGIQLTIMGTTYILCAETEDAKQFWIMDITKALDQIEKRKGITKR